MLNYIHKENAVSIDLLCWLFSGGMKTGILRQPASN